MVGCFECWEDKFREVSFHYADVGVDKFHFIFVLLISNNAARCSNEAMYSLVVS